MTIKPRRIVSKVANGLLIKKIANEASSDKYGKIIQRGRLRRYSTTIMNISTIIRRSEMHQIHQSMEGEKIVILMMFRE
jgi:hypothetical protein